MKLLGYKLYDITRVVPAPALAKLRRIAFWVELNEPHHPCMCYHPDAAWLRDNGMNPEKAGCVEIANARNFLSWSFDQPWMVLHELSHGYHDQFLPDGYQNKEILAAYHHAMEAKLYDSVLRCGGRVERAYAATNQMEYFAESCEAFFGTNDFYPFVNTELRKHDPQCYETVKKAWGVTGAVAPIDERGRVQRSVSLASPARVAACEGAAVGAGRTVPTERQPLMVRGPLQRGTVRRTRGAHRRQMGGERLQEFVQLGVGKHRPKTAELICTTTSARLLDSGGGATRTPPLWPRKTICNASAVVLACQPWGRRGSSAGSFVISPQMRCHSAAMSRLVVRSKLALIRWIVCSVVISLASGWLSAARSLPIRRAMQPRKPGSELSIPTMEDEVRRFRGRRSQLDPVAVEPDRFRRGKFGDPLNMHLDHAAVGDGLILRCPAEMDFQLAALGIRSQHQFRRASGFGNACHR